MISWLNLNLKPAKCSDRTGFSQSYWGVRCLIREAAPLAEITGSFIASMNIKRGDFFAICLLKRIPTLFLFYVFLFICPAVFTVS